jgi:hypothetical protein
LVNSPGGDAPAAVSADRELARRLVAYAASRPISQSSGAAAQAHAACERTHFDLTRTLGAIAADALLERALDGARRRHPLLQQIRIGRPTAAKQEGLGPMIQAHGEEKVACALVDTLEALLALLGRLVGHDMVVRLVEPPGQAGTQDEGSR